MYSDIICPVCGSNDLKKITRQHFIDEAFDCQKTIELPEYHCNGCESSGDFFDDNDAIISSELKSLKNTCVSNIINDFLDNNRSMSSIERALELPQRTLAKWKSGTTAPSSSGVALMKFLRLFPWLIEVSENNYDYKISQNIFIKQAVHDFLDLIKSDKRNPDIKIQTGNSVTVIVNMVDNTVIDDFQEAAIVDVTDYNVALAT